MRLSPLGTARRVEILDILRGLALLGILVVNVRYYFHPLAAEAAGVALDVEPLDRLARMATTFFAQGKFYALFSFLFGVGFAIQADRIEARGESSARFLARRLTGLLLLGIAHALLLWYGDILFIYAVVGFALIPFRRRGARTLVAWAGLLIVVPLLLQTLVTLLALTGSVPAIAEGLERRAAEAPALVERAVQAYAHGGLGEIFAMRWVEWTSLLGPALLFSGPQILGLFLIGMATGRAGTLGGLESPGHGVRRVLLASLPIGLVGALLLVATTEKGEFGAPSLPGLAGLAGLLLGAPALTACYVCVAAIARTRPWPRRILIRLAPVGRMALSNYLAQSFVLTTLAYSYGLGLYDRISAAAGFVLAVAVFLVQVPLSAWWLSRFRFGPAEWAWRCLTYGARQPFVRRARADPYNVGRNEGA